eukprot:2484819-Pyramimonas_sp.AAC.1
MSGHPLPGGFNHGATVFLTKNLEGDSLREVRKKAAGARPLFLGNAVNKTFASMLLSFPARKNRAGLIQGRGALDNIMLIESDFLEHAVFQGAERAGQLLLDFAAAFPSLARAWILTALQHMLIPDYVVDAAQQLYRDIYLSIRLGVALSEDIILHEKSNRGVRYLVYYLPLLLILFPDVCIMV